jgi:hypothetical protein
MQLREAVKLVRAARELRRKGDFRAASQNCNRALDLAPNYPGGLLERAAAYLWFCGSRWQSLTREQRLEYVLWSKQDCDRCVEVFREWSRPAVFLVQVEVYLALLRGGRDGLERARRLADELLENKSAFDPPPDTWEKSFAFCCRAQCNHALGDFTRAERDYMESIRLEPDEPQWYNSRARFWDSQGKGDLAAKDRAQANDLRIHKGEPENNSRAPLRGNPLPLNQH